MGRTKKNVQERTRRDAIAKKTDARLPDSLPAGITRIPGKTDVKRRLNADIVARIVAGEDVKDVARSHDVSPAQCTRILRLAQGRIVGRFTDDARHYVGRDKDGNETFVTHKEWRDAQDDNA